MASNCVIPFNAKSDIWYSQFGELTDQGRQTTLALGTRLRHLYVDQLGFMPKIITDSDSIYLRATPMTRALERYFKITYDHIGRLLLIIKYNSVQQSFWGMYPLKTRAVSFKPPTIFTRAPTEETLFPNDSNCRRFNQLSRAFAQRTADRCKGFYQI